MRTLVAVALSLLVASTTAEASPRAKAAHGHAGKHASSGKGERAHRAPRAVEPARRGARVAAVERLPIAGQSNGVPWGGTLHAAAELPAGEGYEIRRPSRAFGTSKTVDLVERVVTDVREKFPDQHVLAIGDMSAEHGGAITQHHSHQSGRDVDIGLFYNTQPANYPRDFVRATVDNLDCEATFALISGFARTSHEDGGAQIIFLDFEVQGLIYDWAKDHGVDEDRLGRIFQYPHGRSSGAGLVRHFPNHDNHIHVRFKCPDADTSCR